MAELTFILRIDSALDWETSLINEGRSTNQGISKPASCCPFITESNVTNCVVGAPNTFDKGCADYVSHVVSRLSCTTAVEFEKLTNFYLDNGCWFTRTIHNNRSFFISNNFNHLYMLAEKTNQPRKIFLLILNKLISKIMLKTSAQIVPHIRKTVFNWMRKQNKPVYFEPLTLKWISSESLNSYLIRQVLSMMGFCVWKRGFPFKNYISTFLYHFWHLPYFSFFL